MDPSWCAHCPFSDKQLGPREVRDRSKFTKIKSDSWGLKPDLGIASATVPTLHSFIRSSTAWPGRPPIGLALGEQILGDVRMTWGSVCGDLRQAPLGQ